MEPKRADPIKEKPKMISMLRKYVYDDVSERRGSSSNPALISAHKDF